MVGQDLTASAQPLWKGNAGQLWVDHQPRMDHYLKEIGDATIRAADPKKGETVLDVGCGAGTTSFELADLVGPSGKVIGVDVSEALIKYACERNQPPRENVTFQLADAGEQVFSENQFDLLYSRFGVMFFDDPQSAFTNLRRTLKPNGRLVFVCWRGPQENEVVQIPKNSVKDIINLPQTMNSPNEPGQFALANCDHIHALLSGAKFSKIDIKPVNFNLPYASGANREETLDDAVFFSTLMGPIARLAKQQNVDPSILKAALRKGFSQCPGETELKLGGAVWIVQAFK